MGAELERKSTAELAHILAATQKHEVPVCRNLHSMEEGNLKRDLPRSNLATAARKGFRRHAISRASQAVIVELAVGFWRVVPTTGFEPMRVDLA